MTKRPLTASYVFFYILFSQDTWRIVIGVIFSALFGSYTYEPDLDFAAKALIHIMVAGIGFAAAGIPARYISRFFKKLVLGDRLN